jgi:hypothetical protein
MAAAGSVIQRAGGRARRGLRDLSDRCSSTKRSDQMHHLQQRSQPARSRMLPADAYRRLVRNRGARPLTMLQPRRGNGRVIHLAFDVMRVNTADGPYRQSEGATRLGSALR